VSDLAVDSLFDFNRFLRLFWLFLNDLLDRSVIGIV
jgi:hypothetical protein